MREAERKPWQAYPRISCNDVRKMAKLNLLKHVLELQLVSISTCDREKKIIIVISYYKQNFVLYYSLIKKEKKRYVLIIVCHLIINHI